MPDPKVTVELYESGLSMAAIARQTGLGMTVVRRHLKDVPKRSISDYSRYRVDPEALKKMYESGDSAYTIAERTGLGVATVYHHLHRLGVRVRGTGDSNRLDLDRQEVVRVYRSGMTSRDVARHFECDK